MVRGWSIPKTIVVAMASALWLGLGSASAQDQEPKAFSQVQLTDGSVKNFIKAQGALSEIAPKIQAAGDSPDPGLRTELEKLATDNGFKSFAELDDVAGTIALVMAGLDAQSGDYVDPYGALQKELEEIKKDASIPEAEKAQLVEELNTTIKATPQLQHKENVDIVKTNRADIEKALQ